jgi:hypothetical protein
VSPRGNPRRATLRDVTRTSLAGVTHDVCGEHVTPRITRSACGETLTLADTTPEAGPGGGSGVGTRVLGPLLAANAARPA